MPHDRHYAICRISCLHGSSHALACRSQMDAGARSGMTFRLDYSTLFPMLPRHISRFTRPSISPHVLGSTQSIHIGRVSHNTFGQPAQATIGRLFTLAWPISPAYKCGRPRQSKLHATGHGHDGPAAAISSPTLTCARHDDTSLCERH